jgi:hypothetical protein
MLVIKWKIFLSVYTAIKIIYRFAKYDYIEAVLLEWKQVMDVHIWLLETFPWSKMEIPSNLINFNEAINIASFAFFILYTLKKALPFALQNNT